MTPTPEAQTPVTREEFDKLSPKSQGYVSYMQGAWNKNIPNRCPYRKGSAEYEQWKVGAFNGVLEAQDCDD